MERNTAIDVVKCFGVFLVVCLHTVTYSFNWQDSEHISFIISVFPRWVIPFFFIVSGYFFGQKIINRNNSKAYFKKYLFKLIGLFATWYLFYLIYDLFLQVVLAIHMGLDIKTELIQYVKGFVNIDALYYGEGMTSYHLWFLTALIWSICILYVSIRLNKLKMLLIVAGILNIIGLFGQTYSSIFYLPVQTRDALFFGMLYTTLGCYFAIHYDWIMQKVKKTKSSTFVYLFLLFSLIQLVEMAITVTVLDAVRSFGDYYLITAPLTISIFIITLKNTTILQSSVVSKVGKNAVGIYVSHLFIISVMTLFINFVGLDYLRSNILFNLIFVVVIFITSYYFFILFNTVLFRIKLIYIEQRNYKQMTRTNKNNAI
ncbi:acyltransferase [Virgibacillus byunsanensis]|uniref:Acyltransferase n=1 Tax=Virgibacillus byunsanensis TaxID=570945 RepID=A0ABW3LRG6_9BACI